MKGKATEMWNERYAQDAFVYGEEPNIFLKDQLERFKVGKFLFSAEGEGRNAVYAATLGIEAFAFDISEEGKNKALQLANKYGVEIDYQVKDALQYPIVPYSMDGLVIIFNHFSKADQSTIFEHLLRCVKPGGKVIFQCFSEGHIDYRNKSNVGGPGEVDFLYNLKDVQSYFQSFKTLELKEHEVLLKEGAYHDGLGLVISGIFEK